MVLSFKTLHLKNMKKVLLLTLLYFTSIGFSYSQQIPFAFQSTTAVSPPGTIDPITVNWYIVPVHFQLFQRNSDDSASIQTSGLLQATGYDSVKTKLYKNNSLVKTLTRPLLYSGITATFNMTSKIKAELAEYKIQVLFVTNLGADSLEHTIDSLVAGDAYVIAGQSNAQAADTTITFQDQYCRTFGIQTTNTNQDAYNVGDTLWHQAFGGYDGFGSTPEALTNYHPYNVGAWGILLQKKIRDSLGIPTAIINGAVHSTKIYQHQYSTSLSTIYGKLLYRVEKSKLTITKMFWYQGEANVDSSTTYLNQFNELYGSWSFDYPGLAELYVFQIRPLGCGGEGVAGAFREVQRSLPDIYSGVTLFSTMGVPGYVAAAPSSYCHYTAAGYQWIADMIYPTIVGRYYGAVRDTTSSRPPDIWKAFYKNSSAKDTICLVFDQSKLAGIPADSLGRSIEDYFYLNGVAGYTSGIFGVPHLSATKDTLYLALNFPATASRISYIPPKWNSTGDTVYTAPTLRNSKGMGALTFNNVLIYEAESIALFNRIKAGGASTPTVYQFERGLRGILCDSLIKRGKTNGWFTGDALYIHANLDTVSALVNWFSSSYTGVRHGKVLPTFTTNKGFNFNKADSSYILTGIIPGNLTYFQKDSGSVATYRYTNSLDTFNTAHDHRLFGAIGATGTYLGILPKSYYGGSFRYFTNVNDQNTALNISNLEAFGTMMSVRRSADTVKSYEQGVEVYLKVDQAPTNINTTVEITVGAYNENNVIKFFLDGRATIFYIGGKHSATRTAFFNTDIEWYLFSVGGSYLQ